MGEGKSRFARASTAGAEMTYDLRAEKEAMLRCADLNPRENGSSIYMQRAIQIDRLLSAQAEPGEPIAITRGELK